MKKVISTLLAAALLFSLAACGQTGSVKSQAAGSESAVSEPEPQTASGLHSTDGQTPQGFVFSDPFMTGCVLQTVEYEQNRRGFFCAKPGCAHNDDSCPAVLPDEKKDTYGTINGVAVLDNNTVAAAVSMVDGSGYGIWLTYRDGSPKKMLVDGSASGCSAFLEAWDDDYLYYGELTVHENTQRGGVDYTEELFRVPIAGGESEQLFEVPAVNKYLGVQDGKRIVQTNAGSGEVSADCIVATDITTGETQELAAWEDGGLMDDRKFCFDNGVLCYTNVMIGEENNTLTKPIQWRTFSGESGETLVQWPEDVKNGEFIDLDLEVVIGDELVVTVWGSWSSQKGPYRLAVNLKTGETRPLTLTCANDPEWPIQIKAQTEKDLLVMFGTSDHTNTKLDAAGLPMKGPQDTARWALISKSDFMNNQPNYREMLLQ